MKTNTIPPAAPHADSLGASYAERPMETPPAAGQAAHTPTLCLVGSPNSGLAIHAEIPGGQSHQLAVVAIKDPASAQAFANRVLRACNSHAALVELARDAASVDGSDFARAMQRLYEVASATEATAEELREAAINACQAGQAQMQQASDALAKSTL